MPELALGTVLLLGSDRVRAIAPGVVHAWALVATGVLLVAPLTAGIDPDELPQGTDVFGPLPRILAAVGSGLGATVIIAGAVWSAVRLGRRRATRRLAVANGLIAAGTVVLSIGGLFNSVADEMTSFALALALGITLVFAGFLTTNQHPPRQPSRSLRAA